MQLIRYLNLAGRAARAVVPGLGRLTVDGLLAAAGRKAGRPASEASGYRPALERLVDSLEGEARINTVGRMAMRGYLVQLLANRLRIEDQAVRRPELRAQKIDAPLVVAGLPRTGTTLLSFLLLQDPFNRAPLHWEVHDSCPPPQPAIQAADPRIARADRQLRQFYRIAPGLMAKHPIYAAGPTECLSIFAHDFKSLGFEVQVMIPGYSAWLRGCDMASAYAFHRLQLQLLQSAVPVGRWSLKASQHLWCLDALFAAYPDARVILTHRDPLRIVASNASLVAAFQRVYSDHADPAASARVWLETLAAMAERAVASRAGPRGGALYHLHYADLLADPIGAVERAYDHFGLALGDLARRRMAAWLAAYPQDKYGRHRYGLAQFGLREDEVRARFAGYTEAFAVPSEVPPARA